MAVGEPPNRTRKYATKKKDENALIEWMRATLQGLTGGLVGAADPTGNMARNAGAFLPASTVQRTGAPATAVQGVNQAAGAAYDRAATTADQALLAASVIPAIGVRGAVRNWASQADRIGGATLREARIAQQQARSAAAVERATGIPSAMRGPDTPRVGTPMRPTQPPATFPKGKTPRTDDPRGTTPAGKPKRDLPTPPRNEAPRVDARSADADGTVNVSRVISNGLNRPGSKGLKSDDVSVTWDGTKAPNHQQFKKVDPKTGKKSPWPEGFAAAKKSWKTVQTKSDPVNPNATQSRVAAEVEGMTPQEYARFQMQRGVAADPAAAASRVGRVNEAELAGVNDQAAMRRLMETPPPGANPRPAARPLSRGQGAESARGSRPVREAGESDEMFDARLQEWSESRSVANLRKTRTSLQKPKQRKGESDSAYKKRVNEWRSSLDEGSETYGSTRASQTLQGERARVNAKLREAQPRAVSPDDPALGRFPRNPFDQDFIPSGPSGEPVGRFNPYDMPRATPTRGKGSTRLRNVSKTADESPRSNVADKPANVADKPAETVKKPSAKKPKADKPSEPKKPKAKGKKATQQEKVTEQKGQASGTNTESSRQFISPDMARDATMRNRVQAGRKNQVDPGTAEEARLKGMAGATEGVKSRPVLPEAQTSRAKRGYLTAGEEKAIKDRAKNIKGKRLTGKQKLAVGLVATGFPAATAASVSQGMLRDAEKAQQTAANAAEEAVAAEEKDREPRSNAAKTVLRDKYGRKITREEFNRREAFRKKLEGMSAEERKAARKKEMQRRDKWRESLGKQLFGKQATKAFRNLDIREGVSSRELNQKMRAAKTRQEAIDIREKAKRNKKD